RADDRPAARQDPGDVPQVEIAELPLDEAAPALEDPDAIPPGRVGAADDRPDHGVQAGAVASPREHAYRLRHGRKSYQVHTEVPHSCSMERPQLGQLLVEHGVITQEELAIALA